MNEDEHRRYIFEKLQAAIDTETAALAREQPGLDHDRIKVTCAKSYLRTFGKNKTPARPANVSIGTA